MKCATWVRTVSDAFICFLHLLVGSRLGLYCCQGAKAPIDRRRPDGAAVSICICTAHFLQTLLLCLALTQDVGKLQASSDNGGLSVVFLYPNFIVIFFPDSKRYQFIQELLEPLFKRSRLHDVSMVGLAPEVSRLDHITLWVKHGETVSNHCK